MPTIISVGEQLVIENDRFRNRVAELETALAGVLEILDELGLREQVSRRAEAMLLAKILGVPTPSSRTEGEVRE